MQVTLKTAQEFRDAHVTISIEPSGAGEVTKDPDWTRRLEADARDLEQQLATAQHAREVESKRADRHADSVKTLSAAVAHQVQELEEMEAQVRAMEVQIAELADILDTIRAQRDQALREVADNKKDLDQVRETASERLERLLAFDAKTSRISELIENQQTQAAVRTLDGNFLGGVIDQIRDILSK